MRFSEDEIRQAGRVVALREDQPGKLAGSTTEGLPPEFVPVWDEDAALDDA